MLDELRPYGLGRQRSLRRWDATSPVHATRSPPFTAVARPAASSPTRWPSRSRTCAVARTTSRLRRHLAQHAGHLDDDTTVERIDTLDAGDERLDPEHATASQEAKAKFRSAFEKLPQREREVAVLLYVKNLTLREIGDILGVSQSRVCQIHFAAQADAKQQLSSEALLLSAVG